VSFVEPDEEGEVSAPDNAPAEFSQ
jgi:hypothetical protein